MRPAPDDGAAFCGEHAPLKVIFIIVFHGAIAVVIDIEIEFEAVVAIDLPVVEFSAEFVVLEFGGPAEDVPLLEFQVADPDTMRQRLIEAGLRDVTVDTSSQERITVRTGKQLWNWCLGGNPIPGMLVAELTARQRADIIQVLDGMIREQSGGNNSTVLTAPLNIGVGTK